MVGESSYAPPPYIPLGQSDAEADLATPTDVAPARPHNDNGPSQWSSGICACFDDLQSCCVGLVCPCYLFGKNAEVLGSGTWFGSCVLHSILWASVNTFCCILTEGSIFGFLGCFVACYACGYRKALRSKYNLEEAPCGDFTTHFFCHLCAICQEYREIRERTRDSNNFHSLNMVEVTAPSTQTMNQLPQNSWTFPRPYAVCTILLSLQAFVEFFLVKTKCLAFG